MPIRHALLVLALQVSPQASAQEMLLPGVFHGDEVSVADGEQWWALSAASNETRLRQVTVRIRAVHDPLLDAEGETTGREVDVPELASPPLALLRGPGLREGAVPSLPIQQRQFSVEGEVVALDIRAREQLALRCAAWRAQNGGESIEVSRCQLQLSREGRVQSLHGADAARDRHGALVLASEGHWALLFAGDLDGDGHTDLLMQLDDHYNVSETVLFLSSAAAAGQLLGEVARFRAVGC